MSLAEFVRCRKGSNAVEFALVAPIFIMLLLGACGFGLYIGVAHAVGDIAQEGARSGLIGLDAAERDRLTRQRVAAAASSFSLIDPQKITVATHEAGRSFRVVVSYDASALPVFDLGLGILPSRTIARTAETEIPAY